VCYHSHLAISIAIRSTGSGCAEEDVSRRWELNPTDGGWVDMAPSGIPFYEGGDWWSTQFVVPEEGFEINFVFDDGEGAFENNSMNDFMFPISGGITAEEWEEVRRPPNQRIITSLTATNACPLFRDSNS
jgi:hypothetical protein